MWLSRARPAMLWPDRRRVGLVQPGGTLGDHLFDQRRGLCRTREGRDCRVCELGQVTREATGVVRGDLAANDLEDGAGDRIRAQVRKLLGLGAVLVALLEKHGE